MVARALRTPIGLNGPDEPHLEPPSTPLGRELYLSSAVGLHLWVMLGGAAGLVTAESYPTPED